MNRIGGLYIYKDGIRVLPYGNPDYDFVDIELNRTKGAGYYYFSYRRMFGYIDIDAEANRNLNEKAGRERSKAPPAAALLDQPPVHRVAVELVLVGRNRRQNAEHQTCDEDQRPEDRADDRHNQDRAEDRGRGVED